MSEWDQTWPFAALLLILALMPFACVGLATAVDWLMAGTVKFVRAVRRRRKGTHPQVGFDNNR